VEWQGVCRGTIKEVPAITRHIEQALGEGEPPGVALGGRLCFIDEDGDGSVDLLRQLGILTAAKARAGEGVRVDEPEILGCEGKAPACVRELLHLREEERDLGVL